MTLRRTIITDIYCDECDELYYGNDGSLSSCPPAPTVRQNAKKSGWIRKGGKDYCDQCAERLQTS